MAPNVTVQPGNEISPRNPWARASRALDLAGRGRFDAALRTLDQITYHPEVSAQVLDIYRRRLNDMANGAGAVPHIDTPADYLRHLDMGLRAPFRHVVAGASAPAPYPAGMAMPPLVGVHNDTTFLRDAATVLAPRVAGLLNCAHVIVDAAGIPDIGALMRDLAAQTHTGPIRVTVLGAVDATFAPPARLDVQVIDAPLLGIVANTHLRAILDADEDVLMVFLGGDVVLDPAALARAAHFARVTDALVQPLVAFAPKASLQTPFSEPVRPDLFSGKYPFRDMQGMNFAAPSGLMRRVGLPDTRFSSPALAARELAFRMTLKGAYFAPLAVPRLAPRKDKAAEDKDSALYIGLCPNHWDRKKDGFFERPRVSIYIPAYNASRYIRRAVDSILEQDVQDLEVCVCNDGSRDDTADLLERHYGADPRVRRTDRRNGGIGFGSNAAIHLSRAPYIGQLDSDDALKPGAVRRLMAYLDENPATSCVYGSCERIDDAGTYVKDEYSWPVFSREKMMVTSIAHHFRMFRRSCWERTQKFREDIVNGIDYDIFLKLSETGPLHHIDEIMYQRRWHGENTSVVNEGHQTANTHRVQKETLARLGLGRFWETHVPDKNVPRRVTYRRRADTRTVFFWPNYSRSNPYQHMLYGEARKQLEICAGDIDAALEQIGAFDDPAKLTFHLHWLNFIFIGAADQAEAQARADAFAGKLEKFIWKGGRVVWTIHNHVSHDTPFHDIEVALSGRIARAAHALHFHSAGSVAEVAAVFDVPQDKVVISRHGHYIGAYPDFIARKDARAALGIDADDEVILFTGQVRPYKGVRKLISAFRVLLRERPHLRLLIVGEMKFDPFADITPALTDAERARITATKRFVSDMEMQLFLRAADVAAYPYQKILTSGSLLLALSFDLPVIIPEVGMTREVLGEMGGCLQGEITSESIQTAIKSALDTGTSDLAPATAQSIACIQAKYDWPDFTRVLTG